MSENQLKFVGLDVFVISENTLPKLPENFDGCRLVHITNRGSKVWPGAAPLIEMTDLYTARYQCTEGSELKDIQTLEILNAISKSPYPWVHVEKLLQINGINRFS